MRYYAERVRVSGNWLHVGLADLYSACTHSSEIRKPGTAKGPKHEHEPKKTRHLHLTAAQPTSDYGRTDGTGDRPGEKLCTVLQPSATHGQRNQQQHAPLAHPKPTTHTNTDEMGGVFAKALGRLVGKKEMRILMVRPCSRTTPAAILGVAALSFPYTIAPPAPALMSRAPLESCRLVWTPLAKQPSCTS
jgi:hypothetical protein